MVLTPGNSRLISVHLRSGPVLLLTGVLCSRWMDIHICTTTHQHQPPMPATRKRQGNPNLAMISNFEFYTDSVKILSRWWNIQICTRTHHWQNQARRWWREKPRLRNNIGLGLLLGWIFFWVEYSMGLDIGLNILWGWILGWILSWVGYSLVLDIHVCTTTTHNVKEARKEPAAIVAQKPRHNLSGQQYRMWDIPWKYYSSSIWDWSALLMVDQGASLPLGTQWVPQSPATDNIVALLLFLS